MLNRQILIEQSLHGYANGHHLIASSINLSEKSKRKMEILSDLSGPEIQSGFEEYYTGYFLPDDNKAVLSYTWYAYEMQRPGCVWTQSVLIEPRDLCAIGANINQLINIFIRPNNSEGFIRYTKQVLIKAEKDINTLSMDNTKLKYLIWAIWGNESPSIILAENSNYYAKELIYLWTRHNKDMKQGFSFSTGSLAIRKFETETLNLQVVPKYIINNVLRTENECKVLQEISSIRAFPVWIDKSCEFEVGDSWENFNRFRNKFGEQYLQSKYFAQFVKIYVGARAEMRCIDIAEGLNIIQKIFPTIEKEKLGSLFIDLYIDDEFCEWGSKNDSSKILLYLVDSNWLSINPIQLKVLINIGLMTDKVNSQKLVRYLAKSDIGNIGENVLTIYAETIPLEMFDDFTNMELNMCSRLVMLNPDLAQCVKIWYQPKVFQEEILQCLKIQTKRVELEDYILFVVLNNSIYDFGRELFDLFGEKSVIVFFDYLLGIRTLASKNPESIKEVCKNHEQYCMKIIETKYKELDNYQLILMLEIINLFSNIVLKMNEKLLVSIFDKININELTYEDKMKVALFYFPIILQSSTIFPLHNVNFVFKMIYSSVAKQTFPNSEWDKIEKLLPENSWFNQWDKCKRLRKAIKRKGYKLKIVESNENSDIDINLL
ncbi:hypothetical protein HBE96_05855 [Clostridium sp. P21]|uniref:Uncharacterized protein n=1 Tax=Clostridium muellerianum TaxID=2716538 RepID=A0A7Y0EEV5_9CLOT|nr:hypothetical protein [Clostridium muellerianum]NMM62216.1 hypothetical protein [Clostridium muellerianum]